MTMNDDEMPMVANVTLPMDRRCGYQWMIMVTNDDDDDGGLCDDDDDDDDDAM